MTIHHDEPLRQNERVVTHRVALREFLAAENGDVR